MSKISLVEQAELSAQTQDYPQLITILTTALSSPDIFSYQHLLKIPLIFASSTTTLPQSASTLTQEQHFQALCQLVAIFSHGTLLTLFHSLDAASQPLLPLITAPMFSKLELLTLFTTFEEFLLSTDRFAHCAQLHNFPCITFQYLQTQLNSTYGATKLLDQLFNQTINPSLQQFLRIQQQEQYWTPNQGYSSTKILALLIKSLSSKHISGLLHDVIKDHGYIELTAISTHRDVELAQNLRTPHQSATPSSNSLSHLITNLDTLIKATQHSIELASQQ